MKVYVDSSALVAVYVNEVHSARARAEVRKHERLPWTLLHDVEVRNALRLLHGRGRIDEDQLRALLSHIDQDLDAGRLERPVLEIERAFLRAGDISATYAVESLARTLDLLHLGAALELQCTTFVSGDERQLVVARAMKMRIVDISARSSKRSKA